MGAHRPPPLPLPLAPQGPCASAQRTAVDAKALDSAMRILSWEAADLAPGGLSDGGDHDAAGGGGVGVGDARTSAVTLMLAAIEGGVSPGIYEAMLGAVDLRVLRARLARSYRCRRACELGIRIWCMARELGIRAWCMARELGIRIWRMARELGIRIWRMARELGIRIWRMAREWDVPLPLGARIRARRLPCDASYD